MYNQISSSLNDFIDNDLSLDSHQKKALLNKHRLTLADSLQKGHWTTNLCLIASNLVKKSPHEIAAGLISKLESLAEIEKVELAGPGFVNIFLNRDAFLNQLDNAYENPNSFESSLNGSKRKDTDRVCFS